MSPTPESGPSSIDSLQFDKVQAATRNCALCGAGIDGEYFQVAGADSCPACAERVRNEQARPTWGGVMRGIGFGLGAAVVCAVLYGAFTYVTGIELGILAILVGLVVGNAVRIGARGLGGRRAQVAAVLLTYLAITGGYTPLVYKGMQEAAEKESAETVTKIRDEMKKAGLKDSEARLEVRRETGINWILVVLSFILALAVPFLSITEGFSGIMGIIIVGIGLHQAWRTAARVEREVSGPHGTPEPAPEAAAPGV